MDEGNSRLKPFPTTQWSLIVRAAAKDPAEREKALAEVCALYWPPVYAYIRSRGHAPHDAEDLTQDFFAELLERQDLSKADAAQGRLRCYLLTSIKNHLNDEYRKARRHKRGGGMQVLSLNVAAAESCCLVPEPMDDLSPDRVYERQWAVTVMQGVVEALRERYAQKGQADLFEALKPFIMTGAQPPQEELAQKLGMAVQTLRVTLHRLRQRYAETLRQTVKSTLGPGESVEAEIASLMTAFS